MKVEQQIWMDRFVLSPVIFFLNKLVRLAGYIVRPKHDLTSPFKTIAICKFKGMGSIIQASVLAQNLREKYPHAQIIFVSTVANKELLSLYPFIDKSILIDDSSFWKLIRTAPGFLIQLLKARIGIYFDLEIYSNFSSLVVAVTLARNRIGFYLRSGHFKPGIYTHMLFFNNNTPIHQAYLQMFRLTGAEPKSDTLIDFSMYKKTDLRYLNLEKETFIVINPNASDLRSERKWPINSFLTLINELVKKYPDFKFVLIGSKSEATYTDSIFEAISNENKKKVLNLSAKTTLQELISLISQCRLMITNDTGPMHIAFATQTLSVALFGPSRPEQFAWFLKGKVHYKQVYCSPCVHEFQIPPCKGNNQCMQNISVDEVLQSVDDVLNQKFDIFSNPTKTIFSDKNQSPLGLVSRPD